MIFFEMIIMIFLETVIFLSEEFLFISALPAICTEPSSPRRILPAFKSLLEEKKKKNGEWIMEYRHYIALIHSEIVKNISYNVAV